MHLPRQPINGPRSNAVLEQPKDAAPALPPHELLFCVLSLPEPFATGAFAPLTGARVGIGAVYTRTAAGAVLRPADPLVVRRLLDDWYVPYAAAMTELVDARLAATGRVTIGSGSAGVSVPSSRSCFALACPACSSTLATAR